MDNNGNQTGHTEQFPKLQVPGSIPGEAIRGETGSKPDSVSPTLPPPAPRTVMDSVGAEGARADADGDEKLRDWKPLTLVEMLSSEGFELRDTIRFVRVSAVTGTVSEGLPALFLAMGERPVLGAWLPRDNVAVVYFLRAPDGRVKVGTTKGLYKRVQQLSTTTGQRLELVAWAEGGFELEAQVHAAMTYERIAGEWFRPSAYLETLMARARYSPKRLGKFVRSFGPCGFEMPFGLGDETEDGEA